MRLKTFPDELLDEAEEWRGKLVEAVAEVDDTLLKDILKIMNQSRLMRYLQLLENQQFPEEPFRYSAGLLSGIKVFRASSMRWQHICLHLSTRGLYPVSIPGMTARSPVNLMTRLRYLPSSLKLLPILSLEGSFS